MRGVLFCLVAAAITTSASAQVYHRGYVTRNGTYVAPHYQTAPDSTRLNNWSTIGNVNPYTGQPGTKSPYSGYSNPYSSYGSSQPSCLYCSTQSQPTTEENANPQ